MSILQLLSDEKMYEITVYDDTKLLSINETMKLFYRAKLVVGPHGAGLSNISFSRPNTTVFEVHCDMRSLRYYGTVTTSKKKISSMYERRSTYLYT